MPLGLPGGSPSPTVRALPSSGITLKSRSFVERSCPTCRYLDGEVALGIAVRLPSRLRRRSVRTWGLPSDRSTGSER